MCCLIMTVHSLKKSKNVDFMLCQFATLTRSEKVTTDNSLLINRYTGYLSSEFQHRSKLIQRTSKTWNPIVFSFSALFWLSRVYLSIQSLLPIVYSLDRVSCLLVAAFKYLRLIKMKMRLPEKMGRSRFSRKWDTETVTYFHKMCIDRYWLLA